MSPNEQQWSCEQIEGRLSDYLDRLLDPGERRGFEGHAASCARCAPLVKSVGALVTGLHHLAPLEAPPRLVGSILDRTLGPRAKKQGWLAWLRPVWQPKFAYGAVSLAFTVLLVFQATGWEVRKPQLSDLNPVNIYRAADRRAHLVYARGTRFFSDLRVVYEIQSRLRLSSEPEPAPQKKPERGPGQSDAPQLRSPRELNRANDSIRDLSVLACMLAGSPVRSLP